jgi:hypothetical protein
MTVQHEPVDLDGVRRREAMVQSQIEFTRLQYLADCVPVLARKPGGLRNGATFRGLGSAVSHEEGAPQAQGC